MGSTMRMARWLVALIICAGGGAVWGQTVTCICCYPGTSPESGSSSCTTPSLLSFTAGDCSNQCGQIVCIDSGMLGTCAGYSYTSSTDTTSTNAANGAASSLCEDGRIINLDGKRSLVFLGPVEPNQNGYLAQAGDQFVPAGTILFGGHGKERNALWIRGIYTNLNTHNETQKTASGSVGYHYFYSSGLISISGNYGQTNLRQTNVGSAGHVDIGAIVLRGTQLLPKSLYIEWALANLISWHHLKNTTPFKSYSIDPRFALGFDYAINAWSSFEPFISSECVFSIHPSYISDHIHFHPVNSGIYRGEAGFSLYEHWEPCWGAVILRQKFAYIYQHPVFGRRVTVSFGNFPDWTVPTGLNNLSLGYFGAELFLRHRKGPFALLAYHGEWGHQFNLNEGRIKLGSFF